MPTIPLDSYHLCLPHGDNPLTIAQVTLALVFGKRFIVLSDPPFLELNHLPVPLDVAVFLLVVIQMQAIRSVYRGRMIGPDILDTLNRDAEIYFAVISTSHFLIVLMCFLARVGFFSPALEFNTC